MKKVWVHIRNQSSVTDAQALAIEAALTVFVDACAASGFPLRQADFQTEAAGADP